MIQKKLSIILLIFMTFGLLTACSRNETDYKIGMVTDSGPISDNHLNQAVWEGLEKIQKKYGVEINYYCPSSADTQSFMQGVKTLVESGYNIIVLPGALFTEALQEASDTYKECLFIAIDCNPPQISDNVAAAVFDKSQAGFLAGFASALELEGYRFGGVFGSSSASNQELLSGFLQGVNYAVDNSGAKVTADKSDFVFLSDSVDYPLGQQQAATLFENGVNCLLVSSDPSGLGALAEARMRRTVGDDIWIVGSDVDVFDTAMYDPDKDLSTVVTSAVCDYGKAVEVIAADIIEGDVSPLGQLSVFDLEKEAVGLPKDNPNLSKETIEACSQLKEKLLGNEIIIANAIK
ncbi:MAG: BMP family ABC transporter substrate-binding protein [Clostridiaceae bacterium]|nr:BMP family ABC transporter substrate-binding protein [Clostridiaceae bacterium]